jgi:hypothetical protein
MADYLSNLVAKSFNLPGLVRPRPRSLYEPLPGSRVPVQDPGPEDGQSLDGVDTARPASTSLRSHPAPPRAAEVEAKAEVEAETKAEQAVPVLSLRSPEALLPSAGRPSEPYLFPRQERMDDSLIPSRGKHDEAFYPLRGEPEGGEVLQPAGRQLESQPLRPTDLPQAAGGEAPPLPVRERLIERIVIREHEPAAGAKDAPAGPLRAGGGYPQPPVSSPPEPPTRRDLLPVAQPVIVQPRIRPVPEELRQPATAQAAQPAGTPGPAREEPATTIHVTIGRIEVRAAQPVAPVQKPRPQPAVMSLDQYLTQRARGGDQ